MAFVGKQIGASTRKAIGRSASRTSRQAARASSEPDGHEMAPSESKIKEACAELLKGLDEDTLEYVAGGLLDDEDGTVLEKDDLVDFVAPMLEEMCGGDEDAARAKAESLGPARGRFHRPRPGRAPEKRAPISLGGGPISALEKTLAEAAAARERTPRPRSCTTTTSEGRRAAAEKEPRGPRRDALLAETAAAEAAELASELEASEQAARAHRRRRVAGRRAGPAPQPRRRRTCWTTPCSSRRGTGTG